MSRDNVFVEYHSSDELRYNIYFNFSTRYIEMSRDVVFVKYNTSDELRYKYTSISVPDI